MSDKMIIGYVGNGKSANRYHLPFVLERKDSITVKTIYSVNLERDQWPRIDGIQYTQELADLLKDDEIDAVIITTPSQFHYEMAKKAILAGKHCVVEKPFTETLEQAKELLELASQMGVVVQSYQNRRFDSDFLTVQKVIDSGVLGDLLEIEMHYDYFRPQVPESINHFDKVNGYLFGHGCHTLDQIISVFGSPDSVHYDVKQILGHGRMNDYFDLDLYYGKLKVSVKSSYFRIKERPSFVVYGKKGMFVKEKKDKQEEHLKLGYMPHNPDFGIDLPADYGVLTYIDGAGDFNEQRVISVNGDYGRYYDALFATLKNGKKRLVTPEQILNQISLLENGVKELY
ncbi:TPA: Gfo/Idh/MocA family oxidoreductase [Klebsiella quasipneumoniae subsp. quasipneumoniae]|nr:Gfo/Idh/MocA family oxidoreductase [Klebsiella quasipneumoniae subsp. quasipneumoniae]HCI6831892.1 Gfo/Idh/MocA family oxidoreductase [Klebsiella quasipneumoniae subsp. quasipneumoniae]